MNQTIDIKPNCKRLVIDFDSKTVTQEFEAAFIPKDGDFVAGEAGIVAIYHSTNGSGGIRSYAGTKCYSTTVKTDTGWGYTKDFRLASESEKSKLIDDDKPGTITDYALYAIPFLDKPEDAQLTKMVTELTAAAIAYAGYGSYKGWIPEVVKIAKEIILQTK